MLNRYIFVITVFIMMNNIFLFSATSIRKEILSNGIVFIHKYNPEIPIVGTLIFLNLGSIYEPENFSGITQLLQSVILKGTQHRTAQQIAEEIESVGGSIGSSADYDYCELSCAVGKQYFEKSIEILSDVFLYPTFPQEEIEKEKMNIIAGIIARKDSIFNVSVDYLLSNLYKGHPYGRLEEKKIKTLRKIKRKDIVSWWEKFYGVDTQKNNLVIVVCGDVEYEFAKEIVEKYFSNVKKINLPVVTIKKVEPKNVRVVKKTKFKQGYLMYGYLAPEINQLNIKEYFALKLLNTYLGGGMSSKLFQILREENSLCYETNSFYPTRKLQSHFVIYLGLDAARMDIAKHNIEKIITDLKEGRLFNEEDLQQAKQKFKGRFLLDHQTNLRQGWYLGFWEIMGLGYEFDNKYIDEISKITINDVRETMKKVFTGKNVIVELYPK